MSMLSAFFAEFPALAMPCAVIVSALFATISAKFL